MPTDSTYTKKLPTWGMGWGKCQKSLKNADVVYGWSFIIEFRVSGYEIDLLKFD